MIYVKVNADKKVLFVHNNPLHETEGLGKTREELELEGYFFDYMKEMPRPPEREGFMGVTYTDGKGFWFEYEEEEKSKEQLYLEQMEVMKMKQADLKKALEESGNEIMVITAKNEQIQGNLETLNANVDVAAQNLQGNLNDSAMMLMMLMEKEMQMMEQADSLEQAKRLLDGQQENLMEQAETISHQHEELHKQMQEIQVAKEELNALSLEMTAAKDELVFQKSTLDVSMGMLQKTLEDSSNMLMELMNTQVEAEETKQALAEANNLLEETAEKVLQANDEMVKTKAELDIAKGELLQTQADVANLLLMLLEGGTFE